MKLAVLTSHPIQYNAPLFRLLTERRKIEVKIFYTWGQSVLQNKFDPGFGKVIDWDIPLLHGYEFEFLENTAENKGTHHFKGIINPEIVKVIEEFGADALLIFGWSFSSHLKAMRFFHGKVPILFRGDSTFLDPLPWWKKAARIVVLNTIYRNIDVALYTGKHNRRYYKMIGVPDAKLFYAPHAIDNNRFANETDEIKIKLAELRKGLQISDDHFVFLFAGKLERKKDPEILIRAFLKNEFPSLIQLVIVGNGQLENSLKEKYQNARGVHFLPFQNQSTMPAIYRVANVFVLPSTGPGETWGLAVNEAMASGCAIVMSDRCGGAIDLVERDGNGFIFKAGHTEELAEIMMRLVADKGKTKKMGESSKLKIREFSYENVVIAIEQAVFLRTKKNPEGRETVSA